MSIERTTPVTETEPDPITEPDPPEDDPEDEPTDDPEPEPEDHPDLPDLKEFDDEVLEALHLAVLAERERRGRITSIPSEIAILRQEYIDAGGDVDDLPEALRG